MNTYKGLKVPEDSKPSDVPELEDNRAVYRMDAHCGKWFPSDYCSEIDVCENCLFEPGDPDENDNHPNMEKFEQWEKDNSKPTVEVIEGVEWVQA